MKRYRKLIKKGVMKLVSGISCNLSLLEKQAKQIEEEMKQAETQSKDLSESMYG